MTIERSTIRSLTEAAAAYVGRAVAEMEREAKRERDLRDAQFAARMAELETRIASVADVERRLSDRLATLHDGRSVELADVEPVIVREVEARLAAWPKPADGAPGRDGRDGTDGAPGRDGADGINGRDGIDGVAGRDADPELMRAMIADAVAALPIPKDGRDGTNGIDGRDGTSVTVDDVLPAIEARIAELVSAIPTPQNGRDGTDGTNGINGRDGIDGEPGKSVTLDDLAPVVAEAVQRAVAALPVPENGRDGADGRDGLDADPEAIRAMVNEAVAALPPAKDGEPGAKGDKGDTGERGTDGVSVTVADIEPMLREMVAAIPVPKDGAPGERGPEGPMGALPVVVAWEDRVYYQGEVCTFDGCTFQASRDTGKAPPHDDWTCIVAKGRDGLDARSPNVRGLWMEDAEYEHLDVVALNGASFIAKRDNPGICPGDGWQLMAMQGKQGKPGIKGDTGMGLRGLPGATVKEMHVDDAGMLTLVNADGSEVRCDLYPLLSRIGG